MKSLTVLIPTFNEEENVSAIYKKTKSVLSNLNLNYRILFIDNASTDNTKSLITGICKRDPSVRAIFNRRNFGTHRSPLYGFLQADTDAVVIMSADFQDPPELIENFVLEWRAGHKLVFAVKKSSKQGILITFFRKLFYFVLTKTSDHRITSGFYGFGLYDKSFITRIRELKSNLVFLRAMPGEFGYEPKLIYFDQPDRIRGKSKNSIFTLVDYAVFGLAEHGTAFQRIFISLGLFICSLSIGIATAYPVLKLISWEYMPVGIAPILCSVTFLFGLNFLFLGVICGYLQILLTMQRDWPLVVEAGRLNFEN